MPTIKIDVHNKLARCADKRAFAVCGNSDYTISFNFDAEWDDYPAKTARFIYNGKYQDVAFTGTECAMPALYGVNSVFIGVYAGDIRTTAPAQLLMVRSIMDGKPKHDEPTADVYNQILALMEAGKIKGDKGDKGDQGEQVIQGIQGIQGEPGKDGKDGTNGTNGKDGADGFSPTATVTQTSTGADISITDKNGTTNAHIENGSDAMTDTETVTVSAYTDQVPISTDVDGNIYGLGKSKKLASDGTVADGNYYVTGFIPATKGDVIRILSSSAAFSYLPAHAIVFYKTKSYSTDNMGKSFDSIKANMSLTSGLGVLTVSDDYRMATLDTSTIQYGRWSGFTYFRLQTSSPNPIVTVNEEIADTEIEKKYLKANIGVKKENMAFGLVEKPLTGRSIVFFGDSTFGYTRDSTSIPAHAANFTGATTYNVGFGGCRMATHPTTGYAAFSMWKLADAVTTSTFTEQESEAASGASYFTDQLAVLKAIDFTSVDSIIIHYGSNDFTGGVALDNADDDDDTSTFCGAARYSIRKLQAAFPLMRIFISLPLYRTWSGGTVGAETYTNDIGKTLRDYCTALAGVADEFNLPVIDGYKNIGANLANNAYFTVDGAHLSVRGRQVFGEYIGGRLMGG